MARRRPRNEPAGGWSRVERRWIRSLGPLLKNAQAALRQLGTEAIAVAAHDELVVLRDRLERRGAPSPRLAAAHYLLVEAVGAYVAGAAAALAYLAGETPDLAASEAELDRGAELLDRARRVVDAITARHTGGP